MAANKDLYSQNWKKLKSEMTDSNKSDGSKSWKLLSLERKRRKKNKKMLTDSKKPSGDRYVAMDCEFVGVGLDGREDMLARVSLVNEQGQCIYDKYATPSKKVTDYRTRVSGIRRTDLLAGQSIELVQTEVAHIIHDKILVGHGIGKDLEVLGMSHPEAEIRDTANNKSLRKMADHTGGKPSLKKLTSAILGVNIQQGEHDSITDARMTMRLFQLVQHKGSRNIATRTSVTTTK